MGTDLPILRTTERNDFKRCPKKWFWKWRMGYTPRRPELSALDFGSWVHIALAEWYKGPGPTRGEMPVETFNSVAMQQIQAYDYPDHVLPKFEEYMQLGTALLGAYVDHYGQEEHIHVVQPEMVFETTVPDDQSTDVCVYRITVDLVYRDLRDGKLWLGEHKTGKTVRTDHLVIDEQARTYVAIAERLLRKDGLLSNSERLHGIMYNYLRKGYPDLRKKDSAGYALNQNGSRSKRQPAPLFTRHPVTLTTKAKAHQLRRLAREASLLTTVRGLLHEGLIQPGQLTKTPHYSCPKTCEFFRICTMEEEGVDYQDLANSMFKREDPYVIDNRKSTEEPIGFEMV